MVLDVKSVDRLLGTPVSYAYAVKAGPWIFLTGHEAYDWETGISDEVTGPPGFPLHGRHRSRREGDFILRRMRRVLGEFGSDLSHAVRLDQYYPVPRAVASYHLARHAEFGDYIPPSTSVVMERCFAAHATISTSLIAVMPEAWVRDPQNPSVWRCLGTNLRLCAGSRMPRLCLRCGPDGAQSRAGARPARTCPGAFRLGRHRDPQADRISDPRKVEAGARSGRLVSGAVAKGPDATVRKRAAPECRYVVVDADDRVALAGVSLPAEDLTFSIKLDGRLPAGQYTVMAEIIINGNAMNSEIKRIPAVIGANP